jgi:hypothetical protein
MDVVVAVLSPVEHERYLQYSCRPFGKEPAVTCGSASERRAIDAAAIVMIVASGCCVLAT